MPRRVLAATALASLLLVRLAAAQPVLDLRASRLVDLTHAYNARTLYWPTSPSGFEMTTLAAGQTPGGYYYSANAFAAPEHGGTHLDAPVHFAEGRRTSDQVPLAQLVAPAVVIDVSARAAADRNYRLTPDDVNAFESRHGRIPAGAMVLLRTGWSQHWGDRKAYFGSDVPNDASHLSFPSFGLEAARLLVEERRVGALGVDTASIDHGPSSDFPVHRLSAAANVIGLENLAALAELPPNGATVFALPMKIEGGSGGPVRVVAVVPRFEPAPGVAGVPAVITPAALAARLGEPHLVVVHVGNKAVYDAGHVPGARHLALDAISQPRGEGRLTLQMLPEADLARALAALGISDDSQVVLYFGKDEVTPTARALVAFDLLGLASRVSWLDGGLPAWKAEGLPVTTDVPHPVPGHLTARPSSAPTIVDAAWVMANRGSAGTTVIDARLAQFYSGESNPGGRNPRPGHIAGARSLPFELLLTESGHLRTRAELEALFAERGIGPQARVAAYCHIGQQASLVYLVARWLGHAAVLYDGSFEEWSARPELPVER